MMSHQSPRHVRHLEMIISCVRNEFRLCSELLLIVKLTKNLTVLLSLGNNDTVSKFSVDLFVLQAEVFSDQ